MCVECIIVTIIDSFFLTRAHWAATLLITSMSKTYSAQHEIKRDNFKGLSYPE